jgi:hypothetical protein
MQILNLIIKILQLKMTDDGKTYANLYAENINLISSKGKPLVSPDMNNFIGTDLEKQLHPLVYGDNLVTFLNLIREAFLNHIHGYSTQSPDASDKVNELSAFNTSTLLSTNIKLN